MITLHIFSIGMGALFILIGFFCRKHPNFISGYNKLEEHQKQTAGIVAFKALVVVGIATIIGSFIAFFLNSPNGIIAAMLLPPLVMPIYWAWEQKHTAKNPKKSGNGILIFAILLAIGVPTYLILSAQEPSIIVQDESIKITGLYGETIPGKEIANVEMTETIPAIKLRTNGLGMGYILKGYFLMEGLGTVKLFLSSSAGPYIKLHTVSNRYIFIRFKDPNKTIDTYNKIKNAYPQSLKNTKLRGYCQ